MHMATETALRVLRGESPIVRDDVMVWVRADDDTRNRIEKGALEHILEMPALRPYFAHWQTDPVLAESYSCALAWGVAHEDA